MEDPKTRTEILPQNLRDQSLMRTDPSISRALTRYAVDWRTPVIKYSETAQPILQQNLSERRAALANPDIATGVSDVSTRLTQLAMEQPDRARRLAPHHDVVMQGNLQ